MKTQVTLFAAIFSLVASATLADNTQLAQQLGVEPGAYSTQELAEIWADAEEENGGNRQQTLKRIEARRAAFDALIADSVSRTRGVDPTSVSTKY